MKLKPETDAPLPAVIGPAIRLKRGKMYSQRGATHESLIAFVKENTGEEFWSKVDRAERGWMWDNGQFTKEPA